MLKWQAEVLLRFLDEFFSLPSSLCIISRLPILADRWADDYYCPASPSPQKQALREQPEELRGGREQQCGGQSAPLSGAQCWFSKLFARRVSHSFITLITS